MLPKIDAGGAIVHHLWDLVDHNAEMIRRDVSLGDPAPPREGAPAVVGPRDRLHIAPGAHIDPFVVADTTDGPVVIDEGAKVMAFTRLEGPCFIGPRCQIMGAKIRAGTTLGPECRIGGEVECSIVQGFSNKYHDGFLGHAYVGSWVNLGAGTQNSDLRNDYGEIRVIVDGQLVRTGRHKVGCFLGDHTKSGLGCLLNTGTNVGAFSQLLPSGGLLPRYVPSFTSVFQGGLVEQDDLDALLATAEKVMQRRNKPLTPALEEMYRGLFAQTASERLRALREAERRRLRQSA
jgi:UDP-N-acetylglucosamine diphosphorylase/glucosamine-1-phosphate N-acetyltransferase